MGKRSSTAFLALSQSATSITWVSIFAYCKVVIVSAHVKGVPIPHTKSEGSGEPAHPRSLASAFAVRTQYMAQEEDDFPSHVICVDDFPKYRRVSQRRTHACRFIHLSIRDRG